MRGRGRNRGWGEELQREGRDASMEGDCMKFVCPSLFPHEGLQILVALVGAFGVNTGGVCGKKWDGTVKENVSSTCGTLPSTSTRVKACAAAAVDLQHLS